jgi:phytepsin
LFCQNGNNSFFSVVWNNLFVDVYLKGGNPSRREEEETPLERMNIKMGSPFPNLHDFRRAKFPSMPRIFGEPPRYPTRQTQTKTSAVLYSVFASYRTLAPFLPRLVATSALGLPMFTVSLQRNTIDVGGNVGMLSIGELPSGIPADNMTWVPLRMYSYAEGGMPAPPNSPKEVRPPAFSCASACSSSSLSKVYPITWEIMLDGVYLDGEKLPESSLSSPTIQLSALVDTVRFSLPLYRHVVLNSPFFFFFRETRCSAVQQTSLSSYTVE